MAGDLSVTALYTSQVWTWGRLTRADLFATPDAKRVFAITNAALGIAQVLRRDLPALRFALLHRHTMIDHLLQASGCDRVVELAAGLSRRGAAFCDTHDYTEIDLPPVIAHKRALLERTSEGRDVLAKLHLVASDVRDVDLVGLAGLGTQPPFVIAEGLMIYLDRDARRRLFTRVADVAHTFVFDLVPTSEEPEPGVIGRVLEAGMKRFTGGRGFERDARTRDDILEELRDAGFTSAHAIAARDVAGKWQLPYAYRETNTVVFTASRATRA